MGRLHIATPGAIYHVKNKKRLKELLATGNFLWINTYYKTYFWKFKKPISYELMCIKDLEI